MPKPLDKQAQEMIISLINYFEKERNNQGPLLPLTAVRERVAAALNINVSTVHTISAKHKRGVPLNGPKRKRTRSKPVVEVDDVTRDTIRNIIYDMNKNKKHITLDSLRQILLERKIFSGCKASLWKIVKNMGFQYNRDYF